MIIIVSTFIRLVVITGQDFEYKNKWCDDVYIITLETKQKLLFFIIDQSKARNINLASCLLPNQLNHFYSVVYQSTIYVCVYLHV